MSCRIVACEQRTPEWYRLRAGKLTASRAKDMLAKIKTGEAAARRDLKYQLVAERLSGEPQEDNYINPAMQWGLDHEAEAIAAYEAATGSLVTPIGFCEHTTLLAGCSPDGFVGTHGAVSIKCPKTATHIRYWRDGGEPSEHWAQHTHELWLTERAWIDFVSFDPRLPDRLRLLVVRVTRSIKERDDYEAEVRRFLDDVQLELDALKTIGNLKATLEASCLSS